MNIASASLIAPFREPEPEPTRPAPSNTEAEQALLGAIFRNNLAHSRVADFLLPEHFSFAVHGRIYEAICKLIDRGQIANSITLKNLFEHDPTLAEVGGAQYLTQLAESAVTIINAEDYGRRIHDLHLRRQLIGLGEDVVNEAYEQDIDDPAIAQIERAEQRLFALAEYRAGGAPVQLDLRAAIARAELARKGKGPAGVLTGLVDVDQKLGGLRPGNLVVLAARPSMGKTALATNIAVNAATASTPTCIFSLEQSRDELEDRLLAERGRISADRIRRGGTSAQNFEDFEAAASRLAALPLYIDDTPALSIVALRTRARRLKRQQGLKLIVIDYLQLMRPSNATRGPENRVQEVSEITRGLKAIAKELDVPVLALSQLSRAVEQREDKRPQLADLRESGSIEQDADVVMFIFREEYYIARRETRTPAEEQALSACRGIAELIIAKNRSGPIGNVGLAFRAELTRFDDLRSR